MEKTTLKDYAREHNVTYEAVRKQIKRYAKDLSGHITTDGRQQLLDAVAVAFLNDKRQKHPVVIVQQGKDDLITALQAENKDLLIEVTRLQKHIIDTAADQRLLEGEKEQAEKQAVELRQKNVELEVALEAEKEEAAAIKAELDRLKSRGFWARLFNRES